MKVLYFARDYSPHDHRFLSALAASGRQVAYLRLERGPHQLEDRAIPEGVELIPWAGGRQPARRQDGPRLFASLRRVLRSVHPDVVLAGPLQRSAFLTALSGFHPLVSMSWGYDLLQDVNRGPDWRWATRFTLAHSDAMVGDCETIRSLAAAHGMAPERVVTFPWGVDLEHFNPSVDGSDLRARLGWEPEHFVLLSNRGWEPIYGIDVIVDAFIRVARNFPELRLLMLGSGSQAGQIRKKFMRAGVLDLVHFPGQVSQTELPRYYRAADLYLSASHSDGSSISLLEALACGKPVAVSDIPGNREWITPGEQGWWFPDGNAAALAEVIAAAVGERERLAAMGAASRNLAEQRADWNRNFPQLFQAFEIACHDQS